MKTAGKFLALPAADRWLLLQALAMVTAMRLRLALLPFRPGCGQSQRDVRPHAGPSPQRIAWAIERAGDCFGRATCLARALAGERMLRRRGLASRIHIGVRAGEQQGPPNGLIAHAWLEFGGEVLVGGPDVGCYTPLLTWSN